MKKLLFATHNNEDLADGIWKKITYQVKALRSLGFSVDFYFSRKGEIVCDSGGGIQEVISLYGKSKYFFYKEISRSINRKNKSYDVAYIRKPHGGLFCIFLNGLLKLLKKKKCHIIMEVPTYPYHAELKKIKEKLLNLVFESCLLFFRRNIDEIVYFGSPEDAIWGVKCTRISNGIDIDEMSIVQEKKVYNGSGFIFLGVANLSFWHGYDRLLYGIKSYKENGIKVVFNIVGDTEPELSRLKKIVNTLGIDENVKFCGRLSGKELEEHYKNADVCIDALGRHRSGNEFNSSIKSKEYAARGLPFVKSHIDEAFNNNDFIFNVPPNDEPIDVAAIIAWRSNLPDGFSIQERNFALKNLTWSKQLKKALTRFI